MVKLFTRNFGTEEDNVIYLEPEVLSALNMFWLDVTRDDREQKKLEDGGEE